MIHTRFETKSIDLIKSLIYESLGKFRSDAKYSISSIELIKNSTYEVVLYANCESMIFALSSNDSVQNLTNIVFDEPLEFKINAYRVSDFIFKSQKQFDKLWHLFQKYKHLYLSEVLKDCDIMYDDMDYESLEYVIGLHLEILSFDEFKEVANLLRLISDECKHLCPEINFKLKQVSFFRKFPFKFDSYKQLEYILMMSDLSYDDLAIYSKEMDTLSSLAMLVL